MVLKWFWRRFLNKFYLFLWFKPRTPLQRGHFGSWDHHLNKLGKGLIAKANFQETEPSRSGEDFKAYFIFTNTRPPVTGSFWTLWSPTETRGPKWLNAKIIVIQSWYNSIERFFQLLFSCRDTILTGLFLFNLKQLIARITLTQMV